MSPSALRVVPFSGTDEQWDSAVRGFAGSSFCHLAGWAHIMRTALGHEMTSLVALDDTGATQGLLPLVRVRSRLFGDYLLSMPFLSYGGPLGSEAACVALVDAAVQEATRLGVDLLELRARRMLPGQLPASNRKITVVKSLPSTPEELWEKGIKAKVRSQIRRPMKEGLVTRFGPDLVEPFYDVFSRTMRDLGTPVLPRLFFNEVADRFPSESVFAVVELGGRPVAAGCGFLWQGEFEITWAGALREHNAIAPNMLLYWSLMENSVRQGATVFNFGRCSPDSPTHRFKRQWGADDLPLPWAQWSPTGVVSTPNPDSPKFRLATAVWSRLPVSVANVMGPPLARLLP